MLTESCGVPFVTFAAASQRELHEPELDVERVKLHLPDLPSDYLYVAYRQTLPGSLGISRPSGKKCAFR